MKQNPFKAGDYVAIYGKTGNFFPVRKTGIIECITDKGMVRFDLDLPENKHLYKNGGFDGDGGWDLTLVHWKRCRRLKPKNKPKPPEEVWVSWFSDSKIAPLGAAYLTKERCEAFIGNGGGIAVKYKLVDE